MIRLLLGPISIVQVLKKILNEQAIGRSRAGFSTKIHALCDGKGRPIAFHLTGGEAHDLQGADTLLEKVNAPALLADKAYYAQKRVLARLQNSNCVAVIPSKANHKNKRSYNKELYKRRYLIENFFAYLKQYRAIATRYDKLAINFLGGIYLAASSLWAIC